MAAGLGFKTFTTGEVLTAADTNGYLMQGINVFANSAARAAAITSPQEGQYSYLKDTNALEYYDGAAWVGAPVGDITAVTAGKGLTGGGSSGDVTVSLGTTAKGDLVAGSGASTAAVLSVGNNGETLVADSSTSTGLRWQGDYAAGKNAIINGALNINQRNFTSNTTTASFNFDRFSQLNSGGTVTVTPQVFTPGSAPVAGYEATNYVRMVTAGQSAAGDFGIIRYAVEDVRTLSGQTATFSFWAKAASGTPKITLEIDQNFGSGGSPAVFTTMQTITISTSWTRYTITGTIPSVSGKTIGAGSYYSIYYWVSAGTTYSARTNSMGVQNNTFDLWGFQLEAGSVATAFQTATGTLQGELAAAQRYCYGITAGSNYPSRAIDSGFLYSGGVVFPVTMRSAPTLRSGGTFGASSGNAGTVAMDGSSTSSANLYNTASNWSSGASIRYTVIFEAEL